MRKYAHAVAAFSFLAATACSGQSSTVSLPASGNAPLVQERSPIVTAYAITEIAIPSSVGGSQGGIALSGDGKVYFSTGGYNAGGVHAGGRFTGIPLLDPQQESFASGPVAVNSNAEPFLAIQGNNPGSATQQGGVQSGPPGAQFALYGSNTTVDTLKADKFGNVWMSINSNCGAGSCVAKIIGNDPASIKTVDAGAWPVAVYGIAAMPDGSAWVALSNGRLRHYSPSLTQLGKVPLPSGMQANDMIAGPGGAIWWTDSKANAIGSFLRGVIHEFPIPTPSSGAAGITLGPDGALWFTEQKASKIGRIDTTGKITEITTPTPNSGPTGISAFAGNTGVKSIWFAEAYTSKLGEIRL